MSSRNMNQNPFTNGNVSGPPRRSAFHRMHQPSEWNQYSEGQDANSSTGSSLYPEPPPQPLHLIVDPRSHLEKTRCSQIRRNERASWEGSSKGKATKKSEWPLATEKDARNLGIPEGYSLKHWDPVEQPLLLAGSVFDADSLGKWILDWTAYTHGARTPLAEIAGEFWLLLIRLSGSVKCAKACLEGVRRSDHRSVLHDFIDTGNKKMDRLQSLIKSCEKRMLDYETEDGQLGNSAAIEFVKTLFGLDRKMANTEKFMQHVRLWYMRYREECEPVIRNSTS